MQRPPTALRKDLHKLFPKGPVQDHARTPDRISPWSLQDPRVAQGIVKDLDQDLHARTRMSQGHHNRTCWCWRGSNKIEMQEPHKSIPEELSYKQFFFAQAPEMHMDSHRAEAPPSLWEPAQSKCTWTSQKGENLQWKCRGPRPFCVSLRSGNAHGHLRSAHLCENLQNENAAVQMNPDRAP